jgi:hypothetical protein
MQVDLQNELPDTERIMARNSNFQFFAMTLATGLKEAGGKNSKLKVLKPNIEVP